MEMSKWKRRRLAKKIAGCFEFMAVDTFEVSSTPMHSTEDAISWAYRNGYKHAIPAAEAYCQLTGRVLHYGPHEETIEFGDK